MKILLQSNLLIILIASLLLGCSGPKEDVRTSIESPAMEDDALFENSALRSGAEEYSPSSVDKSIIINYCNDLKTLAFESNAMTATALNYASYKELPLKEILRNPMVVHLQFLEIKEEGTNNPIHFYDLSLEEREEFLNAYLIEEQKNLEEKVALIPDLLSEIESYDLACEKVFSARDIKRLDYESMDFHKFSGIKTRSSNTLNKHSIPVEEEDLFDLIEEELASQNIVQTKIDETSDLSPRSLRSSSGSGWGDDATIRNRIIAQHKRDGVSKGDIIIREKCWWKIGKMFSPGGHAGIINTPLIWNAEKEYDFSIDSTPENKKEGHSDGVQYMNFGSWCRPHAVLGIQKSSYT